MVRFDETGMFIKFGLDAETGFENLEGIKLYVVTYNDDGSYVWANHIALSPRI
jgi:hypothetical protein